MLNYNPKDLEPLVSNVFPQSFSNYVLDIETNPIDLSRLLSLVSINLSHFYKQINGNDWEKDKLIEMQENGLIYISYNVPLNGSSGVAGDLVGFISFVDTQDQEGRVLYLYEIQIHPKYQGQGIGKFLIQKFHELAKNLGHLKRDGETKVGFLEEDGSLLKGTKLTVFSENKVVEWYKKLGYVLSEDSPQDRKLRSGKVVKPEYYLLYREILNG